MVYPIQYAQPALSQIDSQLYAMRTYLSEAITTMAAGTVSIDYVLSIHNALETTLARLTSLEGTPGLAAYAKLIKGNAGLDIVAEFTAVKTEISNAMAWMVANLPKENATGQGWLHYMRFSGNSLVKITFTSVQTAGFRTVLQNLVNTMSV